MMRSKLILLVLGIWVSMKVSAQDPVPRQAEADKNSEPIYSSQEMQQLMSFISVSDPIPLNFKGTAENRIEDPYGELVPFWEKLSQLDRPLRIVHIGDSHVRGHLFPYVVRRALEEDFGCEAVANIPVNYRTSGVAVETGMSGIVYHILGVNGATCRTYSTEERIQQIVKLDPDLIIISFGTNEAHNRRYSQNEHLEQMGFLVSCLKAKCPDAAFLLTTPPGAYMRNGRRGRIINPRTSRVVITECVFARNNRVALWDLYNIVGGTKYACRNWSGAKMYQRDKIHFTCEGYTLQGLLLHEALIKAYNDYVATKLE